MTCMLWLVLEGCVLFAKTLGVLGPAPAPGESSEREAIVALKLPGPERLPEDPVDLLSVTCGLGSGGPRKCREFEFEAEFGADDAELGAPLAPIPPLPPLPLPPVPRLLQSLEPFPPLPECCREDRVGVVKLLLGDVLVLLAPDPFEPALAAEAVADRVAERRRVLGVFWILLLTGVWCVVCPCPCVRPFPPGVLGAPWLLGWRPRLPGVLGILKLLISATGCVVPE
ncbi:hypothetical protein BC939DRAFT_476960 [Gamsiella multidivaricata]|uniref:uncharacterized protein n=1 Tax=Gamsiella multidivaricata TaxID=101098 RepID=UPI00221EF845|nr:uncharacterized protein BC939DRAFT_476960 [Gamsiella multidivaricata]KAI7823782.1 hypothetical protein BC939DRAFT_476960 [Gamsiella multidivaricata]